MTEDEIKQRIIDAGLPLWTPEKGGWKHWFCSNADGPVDYDGGVMFADGGTNDGSGWYWGRNVNGTIIAYLALPSNTPADAKETTLSDAIATVNASGTHVAVEKRTVKDWYEWFTAGPTVSMPTEKHLRMLGLVAPDALTNALGRVRRVGRGRV